MPPPKYRPGDVVGELTLLRLIPGRGASPTQERVEPKWHCQCSCGVLTDVRTSNLNSGNVVSCGHVRNQLASERMAKRHEAKRMGRPPRTRKQADIADVPLVPPKNPWAILKTYTKR